MLKNYNFLLAATLFALPLAASAQPIEMLRGPAKVSHTEVQSVVPAADTLYAQYTGGTSAGVALSEDFEESRDAADGYLADEFVVPAEEAWSISAVTIQHFYLVDGGGTFASPSTFNVIVWSDDNGKPGATEVARFDELTPTSDTAAEGVVGELVLEFDPSIVLNPGTYWLTVQANITFIPNRTRFLWFSSPTVFGETAHLFNYGGGITDVGTCNQAWGPIGSVECGSDGNGDPSLYFQVLGSQVAVDNEDGAAPQRLVLGSSYPNPAASSTTVPFSLERPQRVRVSIFDVLGREVLVAADKVFAAGDRSVTVDLATLPNGFYIYRVATASQTLARRMVVAH